jgi:hypothetical protein
MERNTYSSLLNAFRNLRRPSNIPTRASKTQCPRQSNVLSLSPVAHYARPFSSTTAMLGSWLEPKLDRTKKMMKGRPRVATGGSTKGTTVMWGDYGLRMIDHHRRISAKQLKVAEDTIRARLRGTKYRLFKRVCCNVGVYVSGNEVSGLWSFCLRFLS